MLFLTLVLAALSATATAAAISRRVDVGAGICTQYATISDTGFYASRSPPDFYENAILEFQPSQVLPSTAKCSLVARFPRGFAVTQSGSTKLRVTTRTQYQAAADPVGYVEALHLDHHGAVAKAVDQVVMDLPCSSDVVLEFSIANETESGSIVFFETEQAGFFLRVC